MKKKFLAIYALTGALVASPVFTSCVDDNESASVTAVRNAKAEQLKGLAALYNAQAEAAKITAEAEAALKNAQAEFQKEQTEEAKQKFAIQIEVIKAKAESAIAAAKLEAARTEQDLLEVADEHIRELYFNYKNALQDMESNQSRKIQLITNISETEAGLVSLKTQVNNQVASYQDRIDIKKYELELLKEYKGAEITKLKEEAAKANIAVQKANDAVNTKSAAKTKADSKYNEARFEETDYSIYDKFDKWSSNNISNPIATVKAASVLNDFSQIWDNANHTNRYFTHVKEETKTLAGDLFITYYSLNAENVAAFKLIKENNIKIQKDYLGKEGDAPTGLYKDLKDLKDAKAAKLAADANADISSDDILIQAQTSDIENTKNDIKREEDELAEFNAAVASFAGDDLKAYDAAIADLTKAAEAKIKAEEEYNAAHADLTKAQTEYRAANSLALQNDAAEAIRDCENQIVNLENSQLSWKNQVTDKETAIAKLKEELASVEEQLAAQQAIATNLKNLIEAAIGEPEA